MSLSEAFQRRPRTRIALKGIVGWLISPARTTGFDHSISTRSNITAALAKSIDMLILRFAAFYGFWIVLSGRFEAKYLIIGALSAFIVTYLTQDLAAPDGPKHARGGLKAHSVVSGVGNFVLYFFWLIWNIVRANLQVAYIVLHPKLPIQPGLLGLRTRLRNRTGHIILANSITLTPGTITVDFEDGNYSVHALVPSAAQGLLDAQMQSKLERIFGEREEAETDIQWIDKPAS